MLMKKNIKPGKIKPFLFLNIFFIFLFSFSELSSNDNLEGTYTDIRILDKISSKNISIKLINGEEIKHKDAKDAAINLGLDAVVVEGVLDVIR